MRPDPAALLLPPLVVLAPLFFGRWTLEAFVYNKAVLLQLVALALVVLVNPVRLWAGLRQAAREPAVLGALLFGVSAIVSTVFSVSPRTSLQGAPDSFDGLGTVLGYLVVFFAARAAFASPAGVQAIAGAAGIAAAGTGAYALLQAARREPMSWEAISKIGEFVRPFGTAGHPNFLGGYLAMTLPLLLYCIARAKGQRTAVGIWLGVTALAAAGVALSLSRAAWLAAGTAGIVFAAALGWRAWRRWLIPALAIAAGGLLVFATTGLGETFATGIVGRLRDFGAGEGRYEIWQTAWRVFTDHPWVGSGLDTFQLVFGSRQTPDFWHQEWGATPTRAHNEVLHVLATRGLLGGLALLAWAVGLLRATVRAWRREDAGDRLAAVAVAAALVAFVVQVQFGFVEPGSGTLAAALAGLLAGLGATPRPAAATTPSAWPTRVGAGLAVVVFVANTCAGIEPFGRGHVLAIAVFTAAVAAATYAVGRDDTRPAMGWLQAIRPSEWLLHGGLAALAAVIAYFALVQPYAASCVSQLAETADADPATEWVYFRSAVRLAPGHALGWTRLAAFARQVAAREPSPADRVQALRTALDAIDHAVALVPADPAHHANRGRVLAALAVTEKRSGDAALAEFDTAIALAPCNLQIRADAGQSAIDCHQLQRARQYFEAGRAVDPTYARFAAGLGAVALAEGHPDEAVEWVGKAHELPWYEDHAGYEWHFAQLASAHLAARHAAAAERWAREAVTYHPEEATPHWLLASALEQEGHGGAAVVEYRTVLGIIPNCRPARDALRRLGEPSP